MATTTCLAAVTLLVATVACSSNSSTLTGPSPSKCDLSLALESGQIGAAGGTGQLNVTTTPECTWTASTPAAWLTGLSPTSGQGSGQIEFRVAPNSVAAPREGDVVVNNQRAVVRQEAASCSFAVAPALIDVAAAGGLGSAALTTLTGCAWTATSEVGWVTVAPLTGSGSATLNFAFAANDGAGRSASVRVADQVITIRQGGTSVCTYTVTPANQAVGISGGAAGPIQVLASAGCAWTASSNASWIRITGGESGSGAGAVTYVAEANSGSARTGTLTIAGQTVTVTQAGSSGCSYSVSPTTQRVDSAGGVAPSIMVSTTAGCTWSATSNVDWLTILNVSSGAGSGMVTYQVAPNAGPERIATITIAGHAVTVTQSAAPCSYDVTPAAVTSSAAGGEGTPISLTTSGACEWTVSSDVSWITVTTAPLGTGSTSIRYTVAPNTGGERRGVITVAGRAVQITQAAAAVSCSYAVNPSTVAMDAAGGASSVAVTTAGNCEWTAASSASWITITSATNASGSATVTFSVAANSGAARSGVLTVAGQTVTVTQAQAEGPSCTSTIAPTGESVPAPGGTGSVSVTLASGCSWTAVSDVAWITITFGQSGSGNGTVSYAVSPNTGAARSGTLTIAGQTFTIDQAGVPECAYSIDPLVYRADGTAGPGIPVTVTAPLTCSWTATSNNDWITITSGASGTGPGTVTFSLTRNPGNRRQGTITIAGQIFSISQARE